MSEYIIPDFYGDINITDVHVYDLDESIRASKYPMAVDTDKCNSDITKTVKTLGESQIGMAEDNFLNGIRVNFDLTMTVKQSVELERYHFIDFVSSQSTMHRITKFNLADQYDKHTDPRIIEIVKEKVEEYNALIAARDNEAAVEKYLEILMSNPCGIKLTARMSTDYRQLKTQYYQRKNHRLPGWRQYCQWCRTLPHFVELCLKEEKPE